MLVSAESSETRFPRLIFGTSSLGNLYCDVGDEEKVRIVKEIVDLHDAGCVLFDSAGKYGAGLALETLGTILLNEDITPEKVLISNKLGWRRIPLVGTEPTFEPGVWADLQHDAVQDISYSGILRCFHEGNALLGNSGYKARIVSVHDPDEYLSAAENEADLESRKQNIIDAYRALKELKDAGAVDSIGVGAKDFRAIEFVSTHVELDWAMFACSLTIHSHCKEARELMQSLSKRGVKIINSGVFNSGFLVGGNFYNYKPVQRERAVELFEWRERFLAICAEFNVKPAAACMQFSFLLGCPVESIAVNCGSVGQVRENLMHLDAIIPKDFWGKLKEQGLIEIDVI